MSKKTYIQLGDIFMLIISGSDITIDRLPYFMLYIGIINLLIGLIYKKFTKKNEVPMIPAILISWILLKS
ncbi:hypothetical protein FZC35_01555 [Candidatus Cytomitobacter indipagum]|uniref:Prepilin type IV endopeptidase peptidase domain-containing protein n=1 Tax=Candidatus Cytomitobacter indipagum TaxID=2601575 RepID=A0A5C0UEC3_9PROT|nr:hypothetical protein [Candidatus Cytomitobacter indipagum]QEK38057.1 hypothetical protein FZC35_01555 [Candidatus Cytomitobacter indipagum]